MRTFFWSIFLFLTIIYQANADDQNDYKEAYLDGCTTALKSREFKESFVSFAEAYSAQIEQIYQQYYEAVLKNKNFIDRLCDDSFEIVRKDPELQKRLRLEAGNPKQPSRAALDMNMQLVNSYMFGGFTRINGEDLKPYFSFTKSLFEVANPLICRMLLVGDFQTDALSMSNFLIEAQNKISFPINDNYLNLVQRSLLAELDGLIPKTDIDENFASKFEQKFGDYMFKYSASFPNAERIALMMTGQIQGNNEEYCDWGKLYFGAFETMPGADGDRARELYFHQSMQ